MLLPKSAHTSTVHIIIVLVISLSDCIINKLFTYGWPGKYYTGDGHSARNTTQYSTMGGITFALVVMM